MNRLYSTDNLELKSCLKLATHGGACCGARHIYNFASYKKDNPRERVSKDDWIEDINKIMNLVDGVNGRSYSKMFEIVLNEHQLSSSPVLQEVMDELEFKNVHSWKNPTGGLCHLFIGHVKGKHKC